MDQIAEERHHLKRPREDDGLDLGDGAAQPGEAAATTADDLQAMDASPASQTAPFGQQTGPSNPQLNHLHNQQQDAAAAPQQGQGDGAQPAPAPAAQPASDIPPSSEAAGAQPPAAPVADTPPPPDTYMSRELRHIEREKAGELSVQYVLNDNTPNNMKMLVGLKNVFSKCLPNMPRTYISRLLFDRRHRCVVIVRNDGTVIGGIAYRPFYPQRFAEIAFCAIAQSLQVSGFGTRLMNWTKYYAREMDRCEYFLTYADNNAVGYFSKQGFTKQLSMPKDRWHGWIKDYDGGTLMECYIHPTLPFTTLPDMMATHRASVDRRVQKFSKGHIVRPGLSWWKEGKGAMPVTEIPGVKESGWTPLEVSSSTNDKVQVVVNGKLQPPTPDNLYAVMKQLVNQLNKEESLIWPFRDPVDPIAVPDYHGIIKDPIDLSEVRKRLESRNFYVTMDIFVADVQRIFANAKLYNAADTHYYKAANKLSQMFTQWVSTSVIQD